jgi:RNA polymerase sigma factor (sigma-70 family)
MQTIPDHTLLDQLRNEENASFELLYRFYYPAVETYILRNNGTLADAEDIFQEAIIVLLQQVRRTDFALTSSLKTYLFAIARNGWLNRLRDCKYTLTDNIETVSEQCEMPSFDLQAEPTQTEKLTLWLTKITENCQRILKAIFFYEEPMESLMQKMGWKNKHTAANQQYKCIQQVKKEKDKTN